jgi:hypothetical protein
MTLSGLTILALITMIGLTGIFCGLIGFMAGVDMERKRAEAERRKAEDTAP